jgi:hypothetical protein
MWDEVADDEDDDEVRNSVSQVWVKATLCTEELFLSTQYIYLSLPTYQKGQSWGGGENRDGQHNTFLRAQLGFTPTNQSSLGYDVSYKTGFFCTILLWLGKTINYFFFIPGDTLSPHEFQDI